MGIPSTGGDAMSHYKWDDKLMVNNAKIDNDHKLIIEKAGELSEAMMSGRGKENIVKTIDFLNRYVKTHFTDEEKLQLKHGYPLIKEHKASHEYFLKQLDELTLKIKENPTSATNAIALNRLISGWFITHIKKMDIEVAKYIQMKQ